jgi:transposase
MKILSDFERIAEWIDFLTADYRSYQEIQDKFSVGERTAQRYLEKLAEFGILIQWTGRKPRRFKIGHVNTEFKQHLNTIKNAIHRLNA